MLSEASSIWSISISPNYSFSFSQKFIQRKKCPWEAVHDKIFVDDKKEAIYKDDKDVFVWHTDKGNIVSPSIADGTIS